MQPPLYEEQRAFWDASAATKAFAHPLDVERFTRLVAREARILDLGCGYGRVCAELAALGNQRVLGADRSAAMVRRARAEHPRLAFEHLEGARLPFPDGSLDAVLLFAVLTCLPSDLDLDELLAEVRRVLAPGAVVYVSDLLLQDDERNLARYDEGQRRFGVRGVFSVPEGAVLRHFPRQRLLAMLEPLAVLETVELRVQTMNGHSARALQVFARRAPGRQA
jgi:SAM-dependent methyltransferase